MVATTTAAATAVATTTAAAATTVAGTTAATAATTAASTVSVATLATSTTSSPAATGTSQSADARTATLCLQNGTDWQCQETTSESEVSLAERELELLRMPTALRRYWQPAMSGVLFEEIRYKPEGAQSSWVVAFPGRGQRICCRKRKEEAEALLELCRNSLDKTLPALKTLCRKKARLDVVQPAQMAEPVEDAPQSVQQEQPAAVLMEEAPQTVQQEQRAPAAAEQNAEAGRLRGAATASD
ncbi:unnamed protein product [Effrenium voratum]|nr:unnamed protein product [Effrenium voratum]